uniref:ABC transporter ATP-binding protein n=1 Tax=Heterorhabditis bacteriophora TaxID=37862 RepID=A0A1I7WA98_HETBA
MSSVAVASREEVGLKNTKLITLRHIRHGFRFSIPNIKQLVEDA